MACFKSTNSGVPASLYNYSYYSLFPKPSCAKCAHGYNVNGSCVDMNKYASTLNNAALYTSGNCPYGHIQLPGTQGCNSLLAGMFRPPEDGVIVNGQLVQTAHHNNPSCNACGGGCPP